MDPRLKPPVEQMGLTYGLLEQAVRDMSQTDLVARPADSGNSIAWIAGHMAGGRCSMARLVGLDDMNPFGELFSRGAKIQPASAYPPVSEIMAAFGNITDALSARLEEIDAAALDAEPSREFPVKDKTVLNGLAFLSFHEIYHIGQICYVRRLLGYPSIVG